jgi:hypothetical protein
MTSTYILQTPGFLLVVMMAAGTTYRAFNSCPETVFVDKNIVIGIVQYVFPAKNPDRNYANFVLLYRILVGTTPYDHDAFDITTGSRMRTMWTTREQQWFSGYVRWKSAEFVRCMLRQTVTTALIVHIYIIIVTKTHTLLIVTD